MHTAQKREVTLSKNFFFQKIRTMANIKKLIEFRDKITNVVNVLIRLDNIYYPLPELETIQDTLTELEKDCQPADVIIDIVADNDYLQHKNLYVIPMQPLFKCEFGIGCAIVDGVKYDWWDGLNDRLERQGHSEKEIEEYTETTNRITSFVRDSLRGLKKDMYSIGISVALANKNQTQSIHNTKIEFGESILNEVYGKCNGKLWQSIKKEEFKKMLVSGNISFQIKNGNNQRVIALLNRISFTISDERKKIDWTANVEKSLGIDRLSKIYKLDDMNSNPNKEFNCFLDSIYSK